MTGSEKAQTFTVGQRVQLHPATDRWMMGDRYGVVEKVGKYAVYVRMDKSNTLYRANPFNVESI